MENKAADIVRFFMHSKVHASLRSKFQSWLISDHDAEAKEQALQDAWMSMADIFPDRSVYRSWNQLRRKAGLSIGLRYPIWKRVSAVAAIWMAVVVTAALAWLYFTSATPVELRQYTVEAGRIGSITLPDGTMVTANAGTTIVYPDRFEGDTRTVYLSGEANFDVYHDSKHPFIVKTPQLAIRALGTKFNVQAYPEDRVTLTTLESGKVSVTSLVDPELRFILLPDEQLAYDRLTHDFQMDTIDVAMVSGWIAGEMNFINNPLENILTVMQRHYGVEIKADPAIFTDDLYNIRLKPDESLQNAVNIVAMTVGGMDWHTTPDGDIVLMSKANANRDKKGGARK